MFQSAIPGAPLRTIAIWTHGINGILLPVVLICMRIMVSRKETMGSNVNNSFQDFGGWSTSLVLVALIFFLVLGPLLARIA